MTHAELASLRGKRLCALDVGLKRIGVAVCDEMHILVSTRPIIENTATALDVLRERCTTDRIDALIIGVPRLHDDRITPIIEAIQQFIERVRHVLSIPVYEADEAFSTKEARSIMVATGVKKKKRQTKGVKDQMAAAVILRDVLEEVRSLPTQERL
jgi:putative Holliday junction resolvase